MNYKVGLFQAAFDPTATGGVQLDGRSCELEGIVGSAPVTYNPTATGGVQLDGSSCE
jgi:hypothetical protein